MERVFHVFCWAWHCGEVINGAPLIQGLFRNGYADPVVNHFEQSSYCQFQWYVFKSVESRHLYSLKICSSDMRPIAMSGLL